MAQGKYLLTRSEAQIRSSVVSNVHYDLRLSLLLDSQFLGIIRVRFVTSDASVSLWLDFKGSEVSALTINNTTEEINYIDHKLWLPRLIQGENTIEVRYSALYSNDGFGLHRFKDPEDSNVYLYTQFAPFAANRMFPCFDQPDLKALFDLEVQCPSSWTVISTEPATSISTTPLREMPNVQNQEEPYQTHTFNGKYKLSTYIFGLCAGPYACFNFPVAGIPLRIFCRQSLSSFIQPSIYFSWLSKGLEFYQSIFNMPYPFTKYDNVFVPEFYFGAMENVGCVTYRDQYIFKSPPDRIQLMRVCNTFLHEMGHMWFGNLVTMKWWDDVWLKESFVTFLASLAIDSCLKSEFSEAWTEFLAFKGWGYGIDQGSTTHPISTVVNDTNEAMTNYDGISYSKGAAVLKQLYFVIGEEGFKNAINDYLKRFAFANADFSDFITVFAQWSTHVDLISWADAWIKTAGLNELASEIKFNGEVIERFSILQTPALEDFPVLREHLIYVEVFDDQLNSVAREKVLVNSEQVTRVASFEGLRAKLIVLNVEDWGYCKCRIDKTSLSFLKSNLHLILSSLTRQLIHRALWDMVRDTKISAIEYLSIIASQLPLETSQSICSFILESSSIALSNYIPQGVTQQKLSHMLFQLLLQRIGSDTENDILKNRIKNFLYDQVDLEMTVSWVINKETGIDGWSLQGGDRLFIIKVYSRVSQEAISLMEKECESNKTDAAKLAKLYCESALPSAENKANIWSQILSGCEGLSRYERQEVMSGFNVSTQAGILGIYAEEFFNKALWIIQTKDKEFSKDFCGYLLPSYCSEEWVIEKIEKLIRSIPVDRFDIKRDLKEKSDVMKRCFKAKQISSEYILNEF